MQRVGAALRVASCSCCCGAAAAEGVYVQRKVRRLAVGELVQLRSVRLRDMDRLGARVEVHLVGLGLG